MSEGPAETSGGIRSSMKQSPRRQLPGPITRGGLQGARNRPPPTSGKRESFLSTHQPVKSGVVEGGSDSSNIIHKSNHSTFMGKYETNEIRDIRIVPSNDATVSDETDTESGVIEEEQSGNYEEMGNWLGNDTSVLQLMTKNKISKISRIEKQVDIEVDDLDELDERNTGLMVSPDPSHVWLTVPQGLLIDCKTAVELKTLLLGSYKMDFPEEWKIQDFSLNKNPKVGYGIVQKKGGPCGVLACVQAHLVKELISLKSWKNASKCEYSEEESKKCLALALAHVLWKCGGRQKAVIAMPSNCQTLAVGLPGLTDGLIEKISLMQFSDLAALQSFLNKHVSWYTSESRHACIAFLYSAILSRGIDEVKNDMDDSKTCLIAKNGYCSQEIVNLLLTGSATSNVFDNFITLDDGKESRSVLKGVTRQSEIGYLALFEHYNSCQVGHFLKSPRYPIWVVCSESHFSVLFAKDLSGCDTSSNKINELSKFELYYYDGLLQQEDEIKLTLEFSTALPKTNVKNLIPPLEHCIRTKWKSANVDWNGTEPLL